MVQLELKLLYSVVNFVLTWIYACYQKDAVLLDMVPPNVTISAVPQELAQFFDKTVCIPAPHGEVRVQCMRWFDVVTI